MKVFQVKVGQVKNTLLNYKSGNVTFPLPELDVFQMGYGLFAPPQDSDKPALMDLATSKRPDDREEFVKIINHLAPEVRQQADIIDNCGFLSPLPVNTLGLPVKPGDHDAATYTLIAGLTVFLAVVYRAVRDLHPKTAHLEAWGVNEATFPAYELDLIAAMSYHRHQNTLSLMEEARLYQTMRDNGMSLTDISKQCHIPRHVVLALLAALKICEKHCYDLPKSITSAMKGNRAEVLERVFQWNNRQATKAK